MKISPNITLRLTKSQVAPTAVPTIVLLGASAVRLAVINGQTDFTTVTEPGKIQGEKAKPEDFVDLRFLNNLKGSGYIEKLYVHRANVRGSSVLPVSGGL